MQMYIDLIRTIIDRSKMSQDDKQEVMMNLDMLESDINTTMQKFENYKTVATKEKKLMSYNYEDMIDSLDSNMGKMGKMLETNSKK